MDGHRIRAPPRYGTHARFPVSVWASAPKVRQRQECTERTPIMPASSPIDGAINQLFTNLLHTGTAVGVAVCAFFLMWSGFAFMSAGGNVRQMESAKQGIFNALAGLAIVIAANLIATMIQSALAGVTG